MATPPDNSFPATHRLRGRVAFAAVYEARMRKHAGPLSLVTMPNQLDHLRIGLSVSRKVGTAVVRNRIKRLIREAYRLTRRDWPVGYDVIVVVRQHEPAKLEDYQRMLGSAIRSSDAAWRRRARGDVEAQRKPPNTAVSTDDNAQTHEPGDE